MLVRLALFHPEFAGRSCRDCRTWIFNEDGTRKTRGRACDPGGAQPIRRPPGSPTPCHSCPKVPQDAPTRTSADAVEPDERAQRAYVHYLECRATGQFPDDPIVKRNAGICSRLHEAAAQMPLVQLTTLLASAGKER